MVIPTAKSVHPTQESATPPQSNSVYEVFEVEFADIDLVGMCTDAARRCLKMAEQLGYEPNPAAQALAAKFAASTSSAVAAAVNRRLMWSMWGAQDPLDAVTLDLQCVGHLAAGADAQEGIKSFFEKRAPVFPLKPSKDMPPFGPWAQAAGGNK